MIDNENYRDTWANINPYTISTISSEHDKAESYAVSEKTTKSSLILNNLNTRSLSSFEIWPYVISDLGFPA